MKSSPLENKTVRPGMGLDNYTGFYKTNQSGKGPKKSSQARTKLALLVLALVVIGGIVLVNRNDKPKTATVVKEKKTVVVSKPAPVVAAPAAAEATPEACAGNAKPKLIIVSISQRHMWACDGAKSAHDSPVITGIASVAETATPTGDFAIYSKQKDVTLTGSDSTGSWNDPVSYWMPFLSNQYGVYGFHDATWRPDSEFGTIDPNSKDGSHGCVELPLASSAWLYNWSPTGTPVTIKA